MVVEPEPPPLQLTIELNISTRRATINNLRATHLLLNPNITIIEARIGYCITFRAVIRPDTAGTVCSPVVVTVSVELPETFPVSVTEVAEQEASVIAAGTAHEKFTVPVKPLMGVIDSVVLVDWPGVTVSADGGDGKLKSVTVTARVVEVLAASLASPP